jgi:hypothetical protein
MSTNQVENKTGCLTGRHAIILNRHGLNVFTCSRKKNETGFCRREKKEPQKQADGEKGYF